MHQQLIYFANLRILLIFAGIAVLIFLWPAIAICLKKRQIRGILLCILGILLIIMPVISLLGEHITYTPKEIPTPTIPIPTVNPILPVGVSPFPGGSICATSGATGATDTTVFSVQNLHPDGKTDNYEAIQSAIDTAGKSGGGVVELPAGVFLINGHLAMRSHVALKGVGPQTVLKAGPKFLIATPGVGYSIVSTNGATDATISNFTADQQGDVLNATSINRFLGYVIHIYKSTNVIVEGIYTRNPFSYSIMAEDSTKFCIRHNNTQVSTNGKYDQLDGIHVLNSSFGDVLNNYVDQGYGKDGDDGLVAHTIGGSVHDITYAGNKVRGGSGGSGMQLALTDSTDTIYNIQIQNNEFWGSPRGIRTGYYGGTGGSVHDITIGGSSSTGNAIHDNTFNDTKVGDAVNIYGNGIDPYNIIVTYNRTCKAGTFSVGSGKDNIIHSNTDC